MSQPNLSIFGADSPVATEDGPMPGSGKLSDNLGTIGKARSASTKQFEPTDKEDEPPTVEDKQPSQHEGDGDEGEGKSADGPMAVQADKADEGGSSIYNGNPPSRLHGAQDEAAQLSAKERKMFLSAMDQDVIAKQLLLKAAKEKHEEAQKALKEKQVLAQELLNTSSLKEEQAARFFAQMEELQRQYKAARENAASPRRQAAAVLAEVNTKLVPEVEETYLNEVKARKERDEKLREADRGKGAAHGAGLAERKAAQKEAELEAAFKAKEAAHKAAMKAAAKKEAELKQKVKEQDKAANNKAAKVQQLLKELMEG